MNKMITKKEYKKALKIVKQYKKEQSEIKSKEKVTLSKPKNNFVGEFLDGSSISDWERTHGRGFWGNASTGYHYDEDVNG